MLIVNFKTYPQASGEGALKMAKMIYEEGLSRNVETVSCPQVVDLRGVSESTKGQVWAQHVDFVERGRATGWFPPEVAQEAGASGVLLNHSEHRLSSDDLAGVHKRCRDIGLITLIFADGLEEAKRVSELSPNFVGYEPPELVGSTETSVAKSRPEVIRDVVEALPDTKIIVGAGVKDSNDVRVSMELGAVGVALASSVIKAQDPYGVLSELMEGFG